MGATVVEAVKEACETELNRLGSEKALVAATDAQLERGPVLRAAATTEARARETFETWAADESSEPVREAFAAAAETEHSHYQQIVALLDGSPPDEPEPNSLHTYLRELDDTAGRVGAGLIGRPLASARSLLQFVNFCVNEADQTGADLFRELRADTEAQLEVGTALLDGDEIATDRARETAVETVRIAYEEYEERLETFGIDPKPVC